MSAIDYPLVFVDLLAAPGDYNGQRVRYYKNQWPALYAELNRLYPGWISNHERRCAEWYHDGRRKDVAISGVEYLPLRVGCEMCS